MPSPTSQSALVGRLPEGALLDAHPEAVGDRLVQRAGLALVVEPGRVLRDRVRELVAEHVDRRGEPAEDGAVAVAEHQLRAVPERVVVVLLVVDGEHDRAEFPSYDDRANASAYVESVAVTPSAASSTAGSPDAASPAERTTWPGRVEPFLAVCTTQAAGPPPPPRRPTPSTEALASRSSWSCASVSRQWSAPPDATTRRSARGGREGRSCRTRDSCTFPTPSRRHPHDRSHPDTAAPRLTTGKVRRGAGARDKPLVPRPGRLQTCELKMLPLGGKGRPWRSAHFSLHVSPAVPFRHPGRAGCTWRSCADFRQVWSPCISPAPHWGGGHRTMGRIRPPCSVWPWPQRRRAGRRIRSRPTPARATTVPRPSATRRATEGATGYAVSWGETCTSHGRRATQRCSRGSSPGPTPSDSVTDAWSCGRTPVFMFGDVRAYPSGVGLRPRHGARDVPRRRWCATTAGPSRRSRPRLQRVRLPAAAGPKLDDEILMIKGETAIRLLAAR